jgi:hypothetical protein
MHSYGVGDDIVSILLDYWSAPVKTPGVMRQTVEQITDLPAHTWRSGRAITPLPSPYKPR